MLRAVGQGRLGIAQHIGLILPRRAENQVQRNAPEARRPCRPQRPVAIRRRVGAPQPAQHGSAKGLHANGEAAHPRRAEARQPLAFQRPRVELQGDFRGLAGKGRPQRGDQAGQRFRAQQRGRPAAQVNGRQAAPGAGRPAALELAQQRGQVARFPRRAQRPPPRRHHGEIAVRAHPLAKGHMHINAQIAPAAHSGGA